MTREELAARFVEAQMLAAPHWARANCNPGTPEQFVECAFKIADEFLAYAAKERGKECEHLWVSDGGECYYCQWCKIPKINVDKQKVNPEPPKPVDPSKCSDGWHSPVCPTCKSENEATNPEPPKPERVAREVWVEFFSNGKPRCAWSEQSADNAYTLFREVEGAK